MVEGDERFGDAVGRAVAAEGVGLVGDHADVLEDAERVCEVGGLAAEVVGDAAACGVSGGDGGQDGVVERGVVEFGFLCEQVAGLTEERTGGIEDGAGDPGVEVVGPGGGVALGLSLFEGTVVAVTPDRWFACSFDRFLVFGADGGVYEADEPVWDEGRVVRAR